MPLPLLRHPGDYELLDENVDMFRLIGFYEWDVHWNNVQKELSGLADVLPLTSESYASGAHASYLIRITRDAEIAGGASAKLRG
jgi:hypothetical protein